jgi:hypothetical protein
MTPAHHLGITKLLANRLTGPSALIPLRVSSQSAAELAANIRAATSKLRHLPAITSLQAIDPGVLLDKSAAGEALREQLNLITLRRLNAHRHAIEPNRLMGYALPVPDHGAVILLIFDSAAEPTVEIPGELLPGNAVCSLLSEACMIPQIHELYVTEWSRWVRDSVFGAMVRRAAQQGGVDVYEGTSRQDITTTTGAFVASVKDTEASGERNNIRIRTTRGTLAKLTADRVIWPYARNLVLPAYEVELDCGPDDDGGSSRSAYLRGSSGDHGDGWQKWAETIADGGTFAAAGQHLAAHKIPARGPRHVNRDRTTKTYDELDDRQLERAARSLADHVRVLRHRLYIKQKDVPVPVRRGQTFEGYPVNHDVRGRNGYGVIDIEVPLPPHCITLSEKQWDAWEHRIFGRTPRDTSTNGLRAPLGDIRQQWYVDTDGRPCEQGEKWAHNIRLVVNVDLYEVWRRSRSQAFGARGELRGWEQREGEHLYTMRRSDLDRAYARAGTTAALRHLDDLQPVVMAPRPLADPAERERRRQERLTELDVLLVTVSDTVEDADMIYQRAASRSRGMEDALTHLETARAELQALQEEQERLRNAVAQVEETTKQVVEVDITTPARLFGVMEGGAGKSLPRMVADLVYRLSRGRLAVEPDADLPRMLRITDTLDWPTADGNPVSLRISAVVENRKRDLDEAGRLGARRQTIAALVLRDGLTVEETAEKLGRSRDDVVTHTRSWLQDRRPVNVPRRGARSALVDCPLPEPKRIVWDALTGAADAANSGDAYRQLVAARYLADDVVHANGWVRRDLTFERRVLLAITTLIGQGIDPERGIRADDIADRLGCTAQDVMYLCTGDSEKYRGVLDRVGNSSRRVRPRRCQNGHWMLHVIPTIETQHCAGLLCTVCRTTADGITLPSGYFELWNGTSKKNGDLRVAPTTTLAEAVMPTAPGARPRILLNIGEAATYLKVSTTALRTWSDNGRVACEQRPRRYDQRVLDNPDTQALATQYRATYGQRTPIEGYLTLRQASERLGVAEHYLRDFVLKPGNLEHTRGGPRGNQILLDPAVVDAIPQEWCERHATHLLTIGEAARRLRLTPGQVRFAAADGRIPSVLTDGQTRKFRPADIEACDPNWARSRTDTN